MLERWNDDKMDALDAKVGGTAERMAGLEVKVDVLATELGEQRREMSELRKDLKAGFERMLYALLTATVLIIIAMIGAPHL